MTEHDILSTYRHAPPKLRDENESIPFNSYLTLFFPITAFRYGIKSTSFSDLEGVYRHALELLCSMFSASNITGSVNAGQNPNTVANPTLGDPDTNATYSNPLFNGNIPKFKVYLEKVVGDIKTKPNFEVSTSHGEERPNCPQSFMKKQIQDKVDRINFENAYQETLHSTSNVKGYRIHILLFDAINLKDCANNAFRKNVSKEGTSGNNTNSRKKNANNTSAAQSNRASIFEKYSSWTDCVNDIWTKLKKGEQCHMDNTTFDFSELFDVESSYKCERNAEICFEQRNKANYFDSNGLTVHNLKDDIHCPDLFFCISQSMFASILSKMLPVYDVVSIINIEGLREFISDKQSEAEKKVNSLQNSLKSTNKDVNIKKWLEVIEYAKSSLVVFNIERKRHEFVLKNKGSDPYSTMPTDDEISEKLQQYTAMLAGRMENRKSWRSWEYETKGLNEKDWDKFSKSRHEQLDKVFNVYKKCLKFPNLNNVTKEAIKRLEGYHFTEMPYSHENLTVFSDWFIWLTSFVTNVMDIDFNVIPALQLLIAIGDAYSYFMGLRTGVRIKGESGTGKTFLMSQLIKYCLKQLIVTISNLTSKALSGDTRGFSGSFIWRDELPEEDAGIKNGKYTPTEKNDALKRAATDPIGFTASYERRANSDGEEIRSCVTYTTYSMNTMGWTQNHINVKNYAFLRRFLESSMMKKTLNPDIDFSCHSFQEMKNPEVFREQVDMLQTDQALDVLVEEMMTCYALPFQPNLKTAEIVFHLVFQHMGLDLDDTTMHFLLRGARKLTIKKALHWLFRSPLGFPNRQTQIGDPIEFNIDMLHPKKIEPHLYCDVSIAIQILGLYSNNFLEHWESEVARIVLYELCGWEPKHNKLKPEVKFKTNHSVVTPYDYNYVEVIGPNRESIVRIIRERLHNEPSEHDIEGAIYNLSKKTTKKKLIWKQFDISKNSDDIIYPNKDGSTDFDMEVYENEEEEAIDFLKINNDKAPNNNNHRHTSGNVTEDSCTVCMKEFSSNDTKISTMKCDQCNLKMHAKNCAITCSVCSEKMHEACVPKCKVCNLSFHPHCLEAETHAHWELVEDPTFAQPLLHIEYNYVDPVSNQKLCRLTMAVSTPKDSKEGKFREAIRNIGNQVTRGRYETINFECLRHTFSTKNGKKESKLPSIFKTVVVEKNEKIKPHIIPNFGWVNPSSAEVLGVNMEEINGGKNARFFELNEDLDTLMILEHLKDRGYGPGPNLELFRSIHPYYSMQMTKEYMRKMGQEFGYKTQMKTYPNDFIDAIQMNLMEENRQKSTEKFTTLIGKFSQFNGFDEIIKDVDSGKSYVPTFKPTQALKKSKVEEMNLSNSLKNSNLFL